MRRRNLSGLIAMGLAAVLAMGGADGRAAVYAASVTEVSASADGETDAPGGELQQTPAAFDAEDGQQQEPVTSDAEEALGSDEILSAAEFPETGFTMPEPVLSGNLEQLLHRAHPDEEWDPAASSAAELPEGSPAGLKQSRGRENGLPADGTDGASLDEEGDDALSANALSLNGAYYVTDARSTIDRTGEDDTKYPVATADNMALYTAIRSDMEYERHGGVYYSGHEVLRYDEERSAVYNAENYAKYLKDPAGASRESSNPKLADSELVFLLDAMPSTFHPDFVQKQELGDGSVIELAPPNEGKVLYAWEYEATGSGDSVSYRRVGEHEIGREDYVFTETLTGEGGQTKMMLSSAVKLSGSWMKNTKNPVAIVARLYDAKQTDREKFHWSSWQGDNGEQGMVFSPDFFSMWQCDLNYYICQWVDVQYWPSDCYYMDDPFTREALGEFDLHAYDYWIDDAAGTITLLDAAPYNAFAFLRTLRGGFILRGETRRGDDYDYSLPVWRIPAKYQLNGREYRIVLEGGNDGKVPADAKSLVVEGGITWPRDGYGLFGHGTGDLVHFIYVYPFSGECIWQYNYSVLSCPLERITIKGQGSASVGSAVENMFGMFSAGNGSSAQKYYDITALDTKNAVSMRGMFTGNTFAETPDLSHFNTSRVTDMTDMFAWCTCAEGATINVDRFDTSHVQTMYSMFSGLKLPSGSKLDLTKLDTSAVIDMGGMFMDADFPGQSALVLSGSFTTKNVQSMAYMFANAGTWDTFDLSHLDTSSVTDMSDMFCATGAKYLDLSAFDFRNVKNMENMFSVSLSLERITLPADMDSRQVTNMCFLFMGSEQLKEIENLTAMDTDSVERMLGMFAPQLGQRYVSYDSPGIWTDYRNGRRGGSGAPLLTTLDLSNFKTDHVIDGRLAFYNPHVLHLITGRGLTFPSLSTLDPKLYGVPASPAHRLFDERSVTAIDLTGACFAALEDAGGLFMGNEALTELTLDGTDFSGIRSGGELIFPTPKLKTLDLSGVKLGHFSLGAESLMQCEVLTELILPADCPVFTTPVKLPRLMFDEAGNVYETLSGGNREALHLTGSMGDVVDEVRINQDKAFIIDLNTRYEEDKRRHLDAVLLSSGTPYWREVYPAPEFSWTLSPDAGIVTLEPHNVNNTDDGIWVTGIREGETTLTVTADTGSGTFTDSIRIRVVDSSKMYKTRVTASDGSIYFVYPLEDGTWELTGFDSLAGEEMDLTKLDSGHPISRIAENAFNGMLYYGDGSLYDDENYTRVKQLEAVKSLTIPASVTEIADYALGGLQQVRVVRFAAGSLLASVGSYAFSGVGSALDVWNDDRARVIVDPLPETLEKIGSYAFAGLPAESLTIPDTVSVLGEGAFSDCHFLRSAVLPKALTAIPEKLFSGCERLERVENLEQVIGNATVIGAHAFGNTGYWSSDAYTAQPEQTDLVADNCVRIGEEAFLSCLLVKSFAGPRVTSLGKSVFSGAKNLVSASFPSVKDIPEGAFSGDTNLASLDIRSAEKLGDHALDISGGDSRTINLYSGELPEDTSPRKLTDFTMPAGLTWIGDGAFRQVDAVLSIPAGVTRIGEGAFAECYGLTEVTVPSSVTELGDGVFRNCANLRYARIETLLTALPEATFFGCFRLERAELPDTIQVIGREAFTRCGLRDLRLPAGLVTLESDSYSFGAYYMAFEGSLHWDGSRLTEGEGAEALEFPYGMKTLGSGGIPFRPLSWYDQDRQYHTSFIRELWLPETLEELGGMESHIYGGVGSESLICYDNRDGTCIPQGTIYYGGDEESLIALVGRDIYDSWLESGADIQVESGWTEGENGKPVLRMKGRVVESGIQQIGGHWYKLDADGSRTTDSALIEEGFVYCFDAFGGGERRALAGDGVYSFFGGEVSVAVKNSAVLTGTRDSSLSGMTGAVAAEELATLNGLTVHPWANGTLAMGVQADDSGNLYCFDDCVHKDGRLLWIRRADTGLYHAPGADGAPGSLLEGSFPDENGVLTVFADGRKKSLQSGDLTILFTPAGSNGNPTLYIGGDAGTGSAQHPSAGTAAVQVAGGFTVKTVVWSVAANAPRIAGNQVLMLGDGNPAEMTGANVSITAGASGSARLRATVTDEQGDTAYTELLIRVTDLTVLPTEVTVTSAGNVRSIKVGEKLQMSALILPADAEESSRKLHWSVTWPSVYSASFGAYAEIDQSGLLHALQLGSYDNDKDRVTVTVTATTRNMVRGSCEITITRNGSGGDPVPVPTPDIRVDSRVTKLIISRSSVALGTGQQASVTLRALSEDGETAMAPSVRWESSRPEVAAMAKGSEAGEWIISAGSIAGTAKLKATATDGSRKTVSVTVRVGAAAESITVSPKRGGATVEAGKTLALAAVCRDAAGNHMTPVVKTITWTSSDPAIATVNAKGIVTGIAPTGEGGRVTITARTANEAGGAEGSLEVSVTAATGAAQVSGLALRQGNKELPDGAALPELAVGKSITLRACDTGTGKPVNTRAAVFFSSDENAVSVTAAGKIKALAPTAAPVTVTAVSLADPSVTASVTVQTCVPVKKLTLNASKVKLSRGGQGVLTVVQFSPEAPTVQTVSWTAASGQLKLAKLSAGQSLSELAETDFREATSAQTAIVTDIAAGERLAYLAQEATKGCAVTALSADGSGKKARVTVVVAGFVTGLALREQNGITADGAGHYVLTLAKGKSVTLKPVVTAETGAVKKLVYTSNNTAVATVTQAGKISVPRTASSGTAVITVTSADGRCTVTLTVTVP